MKKKVYEKQMSQLRSGSTSDLKRDNGVKSKSKKAKTAGRQEGRPDRMRISAPSAAVTSKDNTGGSTSGARAPSPPRKVCALPRVDVLMKRRVVEPAASVTIPGPAVFQTSATTASTAVVEGEESKKSEGSSQHDNMNQDSTPTSSVAVPVVASSSHLIEAPATSVPLEKPSELLAESDQPPSSSLRYRVDLNPAADQDKVTDLQKNEGTVQSETLPNTVSAPVTSMDSGCLLEGSVESHRYVTMLSTSQVVNGVSEAQIYPVPSISHHIDCASSVSLAPNAPQPVSLVSSPQVLPTRDQYSTDDTASFPTHPGDYAIPQQHQTITTSGNHELHTLTPVMFPASRRLTEVGQQPREDNYATMYPVHTGSSWDQENNRYVDYPSSSWRHHGHDNIYTTGTLSLNRPFINSNSNGGNNSTSITAVKNNNDASLPDNNTGSKLHHLHAVIADNQMDSDAYINGYTSDESSCAKVSLGGSGRRRRKRVQTPVQRSAANMRERRRMCHLNDAFNYLKEHLPNVKDKKKLSRIQTLKAAIYYIRLLRDSLQIQ